MASFRRSVRSENCAALKAFLREGRWSATRSMVPFVPRRASLRVVVGGSEDDEEKFRVPKL